MPETTRKRPARQRIREALTARKAAKAEQHRQAKNQTLVAMQSGQHIYAGTVPAPVIAKRRKANKVARASRRANRR